MLHNRPVFDEEHALLRESVRRFAAARIQPHFQEWEKAGIIDRALWPAAGQAGLLCPQVPEQYGGIGGDFRHNAVVIEELAYSGFAGPATDFSVHSDVCCGYLLHYGTEEQKKKWLPRMVAGEAVCAIAMTEPGTGSDLQGIRTRAVREGDEYVISGQKTFISNGQMCDLVIVVVRTNPDGGSRGMSLVLVETERAGFRHGRNLDKLGHLSSDTSELFFDQVRVPVSNLLGSEGGAMAALMSELPQERLTIALHSIAAAQKAFDITKDYVSERKAFGQADRKLFRTRASGWPISSPIFRLDGPMSTSACANTFAASSRPMRLRPQNFGPPRCTEGWSTSACSSSAATVLCANTRFAACLRMRGCCVSMAARPRSCAS